MKLLHAPRLLLAFTATLLLAACGGDDIASVAGKSGGGPSGPGCPAGTAIGAPCGGGKLFDNAYQGGTYLVMALNDIPGLRWKADQTATTGASDTGDGRQNTGTFNPTHPASLACQNLTAGGATDWYLPARDELAIMVSNNSLAALGLIQVLGTIYWSSNQGVFPGYAQSRSWDGTSWAQGDTLKDTANTVRCIRRPAIMP